MTICVEQINRPPNDDDLLNRQIRLSKEMDGCHVQARNTKAAVIILLIIIIVIMMMMIKLIAPIPLSRYYNLSNRYGGIDWFSWVAS